ncbi:MAG: hypothetical protein JO217_01520 [Acidobacteriaceae bacterium]|nr:hypothetical protein [Acidobacteriaceae bacterium]
MAGDGYASAIQPGAAFNNAGLAQPIATLIDEVAKWSDKVTDKDIVEYDIAFAAVGAASERE